MSNTWLSRWRKKHSDLSVPCIVSGRWLEFSQDGSGHAHEGEAIKLTVMTATTGDRSRKICELIVTREELQRVLSLIERPST
jgi:hypothetical protein